MRGLTLVEGETSANAVSFSAASCTLYRFHEFPPARQEFAARCGLDASLQIGQDYLMASEPVMYGAAPGYMSVCLSNFSKFANCIQPLTLSVQFCPVDQEDFIDLVHETATGLNNSMSMMDQVVALSAIHAAARSGLENNNLIDQMTRMAKLNQAAIDKLRK